MANQTHEYATYNVSTAERVSQAVTTTADVNCLVFGRMLQSSWGGEETIS